MITPFLNLQEENCLTGHSISGNFVFVSEKLCHPSEKVQFGSIFAFCYMSGTLQVRTSNRI